MLSEQAILNFQKLFHQQFGKKLSSNEARDLSTKFYVAIKVISKTTYDTRTI